ncbi:hypothetical protein JCGZ_03715 [Jatropha curcas]|uniref:Uncharacterized protein n=1 Tax=Jatropha curcas TaxID=180498 RepID=A0A067KWR6_JATCU|nr:hypothetical protein JCGZ_03715 [Jatropha curcas]
MKTSNLYPLVGADMPYTMAATLSAFLANQQGAVRMVLTHGGDLVIEDSEAD